jgi:hypothetical protein
MRRKRLSCALAVLFVFAIAFAVIAADKGADEIQIKAGLWATPTKSPVLLTHKKHYDEYKIACAECHHVFKDGKNVWKEGDPVERCEKCHTEPTIEKEKQLPPEQQKLNLKLAFHNNCVTCHQKNKKDNPQSKAPVACAACHPAKK